MDVTIAAVGRLRAGPERDLLEDYVSRFDRTGRGLGLGPVRVVEVEAKKSGIAAEGPLLARAVEGAGRLCVLDERGRTLTSPKFADRLAGWRDEAAGPTAFVIGGADGVSPDLRDRADLVLSFGQMVWPHMLVRVMLAEQLYRAAAILAGTPYHRA